MTTVFEVELEAPMRTGTICTDNKSGVAVV